MSERNQKKISLMLVNTDKRAYNAFKNIISNTKHESDLKSAYSGFKNQQKQMRYPFGLTEQRFHWQDNTNKLHVAAGTELQGKLKHRSQNVKDCLDGGLQSFFDSRKRNLSQEDCNRRVQPNAKLLENINSVRVLQAHRDVLDHL